MILRMNQYNVNLQHWIIWNLLYLLINFYELYARGLLTLSSETSTENLMKSTQLIHHK